ncbi:MAG: ABC transporter permease [Pirellulales bacterium]|nr:ABC transporter permease [Pirellulales bacterium]
MSLWKIAWRSIQQRSLASSLTGFSMALGVALVVAVLVMSGVIKQSFQSGPGLGYNMIVGAKGGSLQLVLNTVYHLSRPVENVPYWYYLEFLPASQRDDGVDGKYAKYVEQAIPVLMGDYFGEFRVVATSPRMFEDFEVVPGKRFEFAAGRGFKKDEYYAAVIGQQVANRMNVKLGDGIHPEHGQPGGHKHDPFKVVGILKSTGTVSDKAVYVNMEGFYLMDGHALTEARPQAATQATSIEKPKEAAANEAKKATEKQGDEFQPDQRVEAEPSKQPLPKDLREVTAILLRTDDLYAPGMMKKINKYDVFAQAALPIGEISRLFDTLVGPMTAILFGLTVLIVVVSAIGIMVSIYNSMSERRHEIAIMRALGARRGKIMAIVLLESILLALLGGLCGWLLGHVLVAGLSPLIAERTGVEIGFGYLAPPVNVVNWEVPTGDNPFRIKIDAYPELLLIPGLIVLASLVGFLPALAAYRTDVSKSLTATP